MKLTQPQCDLQVLHERMITRKSSSEDWDTLCSHADSRCQHIGHVKTLVTSLAPATKHDSGEIDMPAVISFSNVLWSDAFSNRCIRSLCAVDRRRNMRRRSQTKPKG